MIEQPFVDEHKLMYHPERVAEWLSGKDCFPIYVEIGPTSACNHRCVFCALDFIGYKKHYIDTEVMLETLKDMVKHKVRSVMFAGEGEPLLHRDISLLVSEAKKCGLEVAITTNGVLFNGEKAKRILPCLSWIRFSVDAGSPENYGRVHNTKEEDFNTVIKNIERAVKFRDSSGIETTIGVQFLLIPQNIGEVVKLAEICIGIGADNLQIKPYSQHPNSLNRFTINYEDYVHLEDKLRHFNSDRFGVLFRENTIQRLRKEREYACCYGLSFFALIDAKGNVIPCNLFYNNQEFTYGNLYEKSFSEIWRSDERRKALRKLEEGGVEKCRRGCRLDTINRYLHRLKNPNLHDNFI